jgi:hypothetical protein
VVGGCDARCWRSSATRRAAFQNTSPSEHDLSAPFNQISIHEARERLLLAAQSKTRWLLRKILAQNVSTVIAWQIYFHDIMRHLVPIGRIGRINIHTWLITANFEAGEHINILHKWLYDICGKLKIFSISQQTWEHVYVLDRLLSLYRFPHHNCISTLPFFYCIRVLNSTSSLILPAEQTLYFLRSLFATF